MKKNYFALFGQSMLMFVWPSLLFYIHMFIFTYFELYLRYPSLDIPMHFFGGVTIAYSLIVFQKVMTHKTYMPEMTYFVRLALVIMGTVTFAVAWEFVEFFSDLLLHTNNQGGNTDTMTDMLLGILGGTFVLFFYRRLYPKIRVKLYTSSTD